MSVDLAEHLLSTYMRLDLQALMMPSAYTSIIIGAVSLHNVVHNLRSRDGVS
jgi:hypothetical protein